MKYLGLLCMAAAAVAGGFLLAGEWEMRVKMLGIFRQMAVYLKARILYSNETLPPCTRVLNISCLIPRPLTIYVLFKP